MSNRNKLSEFIILFVLFLCYQSPGWALLPVHEYKLENGLKILIQEDHRSPVVVSQVWYKVGGSYEFEGSTGISHFLEHMMFQGTERHPSGVFSQKIAEQGGEENAFTSSDYTAYFQQLEKSRLAISFELESDRMRYLKLNEKEFDKERKVVMEERRLRTEDQPLGLLSEQFYATAFLNNPYRHPVIGWMEEIETLSLEDLKAWYHNWYAPNNATLVVVGDVDPEATYQLAKQYFAPLPANTKIIAPRNRPEIAQYGMRRFTVKVPAKLPHLMMGYRVPSLKSASNRRDAYALEILAHILDGGNSARFARNLVRGSQIAATTEVGYDIYSRLETLFEVGGVPAQGKSIADLEQAILGEIERLQQDLVSDEELTRVRNQMIAEQVFARDSGFYQAMRLGILESNGLGYQALDQYLPEISAVRPEDIRAVVKHYLVKDRLTVGILEPVATAKVPESDTASTSHVR